jgi:hypothetical protein
MPEEESEDADEVTYKAVIDFTPDDSVYFGMAVVVTSAGNSDTMSPGEE